MADYRCALDLAHEPRPENALDCAAGMVRTHAEQEGRTRVVPVQHLDEPGYALARSAKRIDVDFKGEKHDAGELDRTLYVRAGDLDAQVGLLCDPHSTSARASATWPRYASKIRRSDSSRLTVGRQPRSAQVLSIFGTRFCTSW